MSRPEQLYFAIIAEHKDLKHYFSVYYKDLIPVLTYTFFDWNSLLKVKIIAVNFLQMSRPELMEWPSNKTWCCQPIQTWSSLHELKEIKKDC